MDYLQSFLLGKKIALDIQDADIAIFYQKTTNNIAFQENILDYFKEVENIEYNF
jgi:hypothetical protein